MSQSTMFSSGSEVGNFIVGSGLLHYSWAKISDLQNENHSNDPNEPLSVRHRVYQNTKFGTMIVFVSSPPCTTQNFHEDLVSSENLNSKFPNFEFVRTKLNPLFSINKAAVDLYASIQDELSFLNQYADVRPLIMTGNSIGGSIASLFTLWLLENMSLKANKQRPLCITFGSPFLGDSGFQKAISERPVWHASFLHVVSCQDPIPYLYTNTYKPFGTFLFCSDSDSALFEDLETVVDVMVKNNRVHFERICTNETLQVIDYEIMLNKLGFGTILRGVSELGEHDFSPLRAGILIQMKAICETMPISSSQATVDTDSTVEEIEKRMIRLIDRKRQVFDPKKKLSDMKINMTYIEWYKKKASESNVGYYDTFKSIESKPREEIVKRKKKLTQYWTKMVKEVENMPKKEGTFFGIAYLYGATNYRRMVEPLDIAEWYMKGKTDYLAVRSEHYKLLEKWEKDYQDQITKNDRNTRACSLTEDSCFWAQVEEAATKCTSLSGFGWISPENRETLVEDLVKFEDYVVGLIKNYKISTDIFMEQSSFMKWWESYEEIIGDGYRSSLADFMRNRSYKEYA